MRKSIYLILAVFLVAGACSRNTYFEPCSTLISQHEVMSMSITSFTQDDHGHIWIGTKGNGIVQFDGDNYINLAYRKDGNGISSASVQSMYTDADGKIWLGVSSGVDLLDCETLTFTHFDINDKIKEVLTVFADAKGQIFAGTRNGIYIFDDENDVFRKVIQIDTETNFLKTYITPDDEIWVVTDYEVSRYNSQYIKTGTCSIDFPVKFAAYDKGSVLYLARPMYQMQCLDMKSGKFVPLPKELEKIDCGKVYFSQSFSDGSVIFASNEEHYYWKDGHLTPSTDSSFPYEIATGTGSVSAIFIDIDNNAWIGTKKGYHLSARFDKQFSGHKILTDFMDSKHVSCLASDGKHVWIVSDMYDLFCYDSASGEINTINVVDEVSFDLSYNSINKIRYTDAGNLLISTDNLVLRFKVLDKGKLKYQDMNVVLPMYTELCMAEDTQGNIWAGSNDVYRSSPSGFVMDHVETPFAKSDVSAMLALSTGEVACAYDYQGIALINSTTGAVRTVDLSEKYNGISVRCMFENDNGTLWLGTFRHGLLSLDLRTMRVMEVPFFKDHTWITNICRAADGYVYINDREDIYRWNGKEFKPCWNTINVNVLGSSRFCTLDDGSIIAGYEQALCFIPTGTITQESHPHRMVVFASDDNNKVASGLRYSYRLNYAGNNIIFHIATASYGNYKSLRYQWCTGDGDWVESPTASIPIYNISYGPHTYSFRTTDPDGSNPSNIVKVNVRILRPWYISIAASLLYLAALIFSIIMALNLYVGNKKRGLEVTMALQEKQMQERLHMDSMDFFSNISHEFRTPLTIIAGAADELNRHKALSKEEALLSSAMKRNSDRMIKLVNQLIDFNKLEHATMKLKTTLCDASALIRDTVDGMALGAVQKSIDLKLTGHDTPHMMWVDTDKVDKIIYNLLSNAIKYTPSGGTILIDISTCGAEETRAAFPDLDTSVSASWLRVSVKDSGIGMDPENLTEMFKRFYRDTDDGKIAGTGVGLYYTKELTILHHGDIKAMSEGRGHGTELIFVLPIDAEAYTSQERIQEKVESLVPLTKKATAVLLDSPEDKPEENTAEGRPSIVVIDDDYEMADYLRTLLIHHYNVAVAHDATNGYKLIEESRPDIILSDVMMLDVSGLQLCRMVRENIAISHIPLILLTAKANIDDQIQGIESGADAYIVKPFNADYLLAMLKTTLENRERSRSIVRNATVNAPAKEETLTARDKELMDKLYDIMENSLTDSELDLNLVMQTLAMSRTKLFYKVKALTGKTPNELFKLYKLNRALEMLKEHKYKIAAIADMTGFSSASHFTKVFKDRFGVSPSKYEENMNE